MDKIQVMLVDDSALVRQTLCEVLSSDPQIDVIATAQDPFVAAQKLRTQVPDVIVLDVEMPRMDGITFLKKLMSQHPVPVIICSTLVEQGADTTFKALEYGAVDIIQKPRLGSRQFLEESKVLITDAASFRPPHSAPLPRYKALLHWSNLHSKDLIPSARPGFVFSP